MFTSPVRALTRMIWIDVLRSQSGDDDCVSQHEERERRVEMEGVGIGIDVDGGSEFVSNRNTTMHEDSPSSCPTDTCHHSPLTNLLRYNNGPPRPKLCFAEEGFTEKEC